ncbi:hypothetical protein AMD27_17355 (plasmid) [Acinetobacter sp. TGL-Y2]|uniref:hypothetical protein n=1 Tax=Acinetobacter sp. TGL-Y2 TaxID=1407071 RepID=UPI0007A667C9|nr:hypothetical protein [Acinetobacter sp. TGL-Y2]AMW80684.1 hypothetical protein AMD27_17355 [Acinetobacter sp. TGL-Y2]
MGLIINTGILIFLAIFIFYAIKQHIYLIKVKAIWDSLEDVEQAQYTFLKDENSGKFFGILLVSISALLILIGTLKTNNNFADIAFGLEEVPAFTMLFSMITITLIPIQMMTSKKHKEIVKSYVDYKKTSIEKGQKELLNQLSMWHGLAWFGVYSTFAMNLIYMCFHQYFIF